MPLISVIVPVYNVERYLNSCVDSILSQTFVDFELLLINDGSNDSSGTICDKYAAKDSRVRVFHKKNKGVSSARNIGLDNAIGEWIAFVDSDDYIKSDYLYSMITQSDADLIMNSFQIIDNVQKFDNVVSNSYYERNEIKSFLSKYIWSANFLTPWCKLFKRELVGNIRFNTKLSYAEDTIFVFEYILNIQTVRTVVNYGYQYRRGIEDSLSTKKYSLSQYIDIIRCNSDSFKLVIDAFNFDDEYVIIERTRIVFALALDALRNSSMNKKNYKDFLELLKMKEIQELLSYKNSKFKGIRRRLFDFMVQLNLYPFLYIYISLYKGFIY